MSLSLPPSEEFPGSDAAVADSPRVELHLSEYWEMLKRRRRLIALCVFVAVAVGIVAWLLTEKTYVSYVVLDVEKDRAGLLNAGTDERFQFDPQYLTTQIELMRSREISERVVRKLKLLDDKTLHPGGTKGETPESLADMTTGLANVLRWKITVTKVLDTNILRLAYEAPTPELAANIANAVAEAYIEWNSEAKFNVVSLASMFLQTQIDQLRKELDVKQQQLLTYGKENNIISADPGTNAGLQNLEALNREYATAVADRVAKEARYHEVRTARPESIADTLSNGLVTGLRAELARLERDYAEKLNLYKPEWPAMLQLKTQIDKSKEHLDSVIQETVARARDTAKNDYDTAVRREANLKSALVPQRTEVLASGSNTVEYNNLRTEVDAKRQQLDDMLAKQAQTEMTSRLRGEQVSSARIVDRALPNGDPYKPSFKLNIALGLFLGGFVGVGLALFLAYMDRSIRTVEDVGRHLQLPALGVIPSFSSGQSRARAYVVKLRRQAEGSGDAVPVPATIELAPHLQPRSLVSEAYRAFRTALMLSRAGGVKSLIVTSSVPKEGKSSTAANLAVVFAQLGRRVLLVDADLHKPRQHEIFGVSNRSGLVSILAEGLESARVIVKTEVPGVSLVPAGPPCPNPSSLLASEALSKFLELARLNFDLVIVDTPPVSAVADALLIGSQTDGAVLCVKGGKTPRAQVARVRDRLLWSNVRILGVLVNNLAGDEAGYEYAYDDGYYDITPGPSEGRRALAAARKV